MLESLLQPQTVAVLGASRDPGKVGHAFIANLIKSGFQGNIIPVNPRPTKSSALSATPS
jgi:acyl-CoA synthetase (NDP forming)